VPGTGAQRAAAARIVHPGRTLATAEARLTGVEDGRLYAHATAACAVFPMRT
jgi:acyl-coenzyme A thioesterase PaaI-like protein